MNARIRPEWTFTEVRKAALALAREVERRVPDLATTAWWKEERHGVFLDYNQNARDRTVASAYSVRPTTDARVSTPLTWDEVPDVDPAAYTMRTVPDRLRREGDAGAGLEGRPGRSRRRSSSRPAGGGGPGRGPVPAAFPQSRG